MFTILITVMLSNPKLLTYLTKEQAANPKLQQPWWTTRVLPLPRKLCDWSVHLLARSDSFFEFIWSLELNFYHCGLWQHCKFWIVSLQIQTVYVLVVLAWSEENVKTNLQLDILLYPGMRFMDSMRGIFSLVGGMMRFFNNVKSPVII